jgi:ubiquinone/menaquinone biosynthesis C-methylase UbiE
MIRRPDYDATTYQQSTYSERHKQGYLRVRNDALAELIASKSPPGRRLRILEIACGPGLTLTHLTRALPQHLLVAIDQSAAMLQQARENVAAAAGTPRVARATALRLPFASETFDIVYATRFIHIYPDQSKVIEELSRVLRPDGTLAIEFYGRPYHLLPFAARRMSCPWRQFQWQYPTLGKVRALMGGRPRVIPLRLGGERWLRRALGEPLLRFCLRYAPYTPLRLLVAEYLAVGPPVPSA